MSPDGICAGLERLEINRDVRSFTNPGLEVLGVVATMFDPRTRLAQSTLADVQARYDVRLLDPPIPKSVRVAEAPGRGASVLEHAPHSASADAYRALAASLGVGP